MQCLFNPAGCFADAANGIGTWLYGLLPDWLMFLFNVPLPVWWAISLVLAFVLGKWGWGGVLAVLTIGVSAFVAARMSLGKAGTDTPVENLAEPTTPKWRAQDAPRRRTLRDLFKR